MQNNSFVSQLNLNERKYYLKVDWKESENDLFHIKIYDGCDSWSGRFSHEFADRFRERFEESREDYKKNVKASLENSTDMYAYDFSRLPGSGSDATFSWKKKFEGSVFILHGSVPVHKDDNNDSKDSLIDHLLYENKELKQKVEEYELNVQMLSAELEQSRVELEKFMNIKSSLEMSVYGKFIQLLNGKKRRIQLLEQNLQRIKSDGNSLMDGELD